MNLPDLEMQVLYARVAWGLVLATVALSFVIRWSGFSRATMICLAGVVAAAQWLPAPWSPAYWLGLAFQSPSGFTTALCVVILQNHWARRKAVRVLPLVVAAVLAPVGGLLYLDASGWIAQGIYFLGFGPFGAPLAALLIGSLCACAAMRDAAVHQAYAVLAAVSLFMLLRLPTGNLWDAIIDPFLWVWSLAVCLKAMRAWRRERMELSGELR